MFGAGIMEVLFHAAVGLLSTHSDTLEILHRGCNVVSPASHTDMLITVVISISTYDTFPTFQQPDQQLCIFSVTL